MAAKIWAASLACSAGSAAFTGGEAADFFSEVDPGQKKGGVAVGAVGEWETARAGAGPKEERSGFASSKGKFVCGCGEDLGAVRTKKGARALKKFVTASGTSRVLPP